MEKFEDMLERFMNEDFIDEKMELENDNNENKKIKKSTKFNHDFERTIPISQFVRDYLGTNHNCKNLKHKGLKSFENPYVIGISNDFAIKNPDCIIRNEIIVVIDDYGNPGTYINPNILKQLKSMEEYKLALSILEKVRLNDLQNVQELYSKYNEILQKIDELEKVYIDSCDLLKCLEKRYILKEIRKYVNKAKKINFKFNNKQKEIEENIDLRYTLLNNINNDEELEYDDEFIEVTDKINRQKSKSNYKMRENK